MTKARAEVYDRRSGGVRRPIEQCPGLAVGSSGEVRLLRAAASIADGRPIVLGDLAAGLDRRALALQFAAIAHAGGSHDHRRLSYDSDGVARPGDRLPPLVAWPLRA